MFFSTGAKVVLSLQFGFRHAAFSIGSILREILFNSLS